MAGQVSVCVRNGYLLVCEGVWAENIAFMGDDVTFAESYFRRSILFASRTRGMSRVREGFVLAEYLNVVFQEFRPLSHILNPTLGEGQLCKEIFIQDFGVSDFYPFMVFFQEFT